MPNSYYARQGTFSAGELVRSSEVNAELDAIVTGFDQVELDAAGAIRMPGAFPGERVIPEQTYINRIVWINADGDLDLMPTGNLTAYTAAADAAAASALLASKWAEEAEDTEVTAGQYSAMHWALKAEAIVTATDADLINVTPAGTITATDVQAALEELDSDITSHGHAIADVTGLETALAGKSSTAHDHDADYADIAHDHNASYAPISHAHTIANVTSLQTTLDGKAASSHTHSIANVTGLQTALDATMDNVDPAFTGSMTEEVYTATTSGSVALNAANGTAQMFTLSGSITFTDSLSSGQCISVFLYSTSGAWTASFPAGIDWKTDGGNPPELILNQWNEISVRKVSTVLLGARVGDN